MDRVCDFIEIAHQALFVKLGSLFFSMFGLVSSDLEPVFSSVDVPTVAPQRNLHFKLSGSEGTVVEFRPKRISQG